MSYFTLGRNLNCQALVRSLRKWKGGGERERRGGGDLLLVFSFPLLENLLLTSLNDAGHP